MTFGTRIKQLREEYGLSREELADKLQVSYSTIAKYETDIRFPDKETLSKLADLFDVTVDFLMERTSSKHFGKDPILEEFPEIVNILMRSKTKMTDKQKKKIAEIIKIAVLDEDDDDDEN